MTFEVSSAVRLTTEQVCALITSKSAIADLCGQLTEQIDTTIDTLLRDIEHPSLMVKQFQDPSTTEVCFKIRLEVFTE